MLRQENDHATHVTPKLQHTTPSTPTTLLSSTRSSSIPSRKRPPSASRNNDDADWVMETPKRSRPSRNNEIRKIIEPEVQ